MSGSKTESHVREDTLEKLPPRVKSISVFRSDGHLKLIVFDNEKLNIPDLIVKLLNASFQKDLSMGMVASAIGMAYQHHVHYVTQSLEGLVGKGRKAKLIYIDLGGLYWKQTAIEPREPIKFQKEGGGEPDPNLRVSFKIDIHAFFVEPMYFDKTQMDGYTEIDLSESNAFYKYAS